MKRNLRLVLVTVALIVCVGMMPVGRVSSSSSPIVSVSPEAVRDLAPGQSFSVNITVTGIVIDETVGHKTYGLFGWNINLTFNPAVLNVVSATEGPFLKGTADTIALPVTKNNDAGYVYAGAILRPPLPARGASGNGVLATIVFDVKGQGSSVLHFEASKMNTYIEGNNVPIDHTVSDGSFVNAAPSIFSTELIIAIVVVVAVGGSVAFLFFRRRRKEAETPMVQQ